MGESIITKREGHLNFEEGKILIMTNGTLINIKIFTIDDFPKPTF